MSSEPALKAIPRIPTVVEARSKRCSSRCTTYSGRPSLTAIAACPSGKLLWLKAASCIVSLNRHGPAANPAAGMSAALVRHHVQLVGGGELDVAPDVGEQLGQFRLFWRHDHQLGGQPGK